MWSPQATASTWRSVHVRVTTITSCFQTLIRFRCVHNIRRIFICVLVFVFLQISAKGPLPDALEVKSCVVSPLSDPKKSPFWTIIREGCSSDPSLTLSAEAEDEDEEEEEEEEEEGDAGELEEVERMKKSRIHHGDVSPRHKSERRRREAPVRSETSGVTVAAEQETAEQETRPLRFSFVLRPVHNDSIQFLHCSLSMCSSDSTRGEALKEPARRVCQDGVRVPALVSRSPKHQVHKHIAHKTITGSRLPSNVHQEATLSL